MVAEWFVKRAKDHGVFEIEVVDLAEVNLPLLDEPKHPRFRDYQHDHTRRWSEIVDRADAFAFVMPEYNHGFNAALKNAIDFLHHEWRDKPVGFVSYGAVAGGSRAVQMLKPVVASLKMVPMMEAVHIPFVFQHLAGGVLEPTEPMEVGAAALLAELARVTPALRTLRSTE
jgi:NAD(P)H-dependent FMN reductase